MGWLGSGFDCGCCCPSVTCSISGTTLTYTVAGADSAYIEKHCGYTTTTIPISPTNGTGTLTSIDTTCVYIIVAIKGDCEVRKSCENPVCDCAGKAGYIVAELTETPGSAFTSDNSGTYYAVAAGDNCLWEITVTNPDDTQWRLRRMIVPFVGLRLVFVVLILGVSFQVVKVFTSDYCVVDDTYTFGPFFDGSVFTFKILGA